MRDMANPPADGGLADMPPLEQLSSNGLVLLLCGDAERAASWAGGLDRAGFPVDTVAQLSRDQARVGAADVLVLDIPTRLAEAATTIRWWRDGGLTAYVLALVAADDGTAASVCVDAGADAWANRECSTRELIARVRALIRRARHIQPRDTICIGDIHIDLGSHTVKRNHIPVLLSPLEYALLSTIARRKGSVISRDELMADVWQQRQCQSAHVIDSAMFSLRRKIERDPARPRHLLTVRSVGYLMPH
jgi:DNA-binding response OmpR family regulator